MIGRALLKVGIPAETLSHHALNNRGFYALVRTLPELGDIGHQVKYWAEAIQSIQDNQDDSWGYALKTADQLHPLTDRDFEKKGN